MVLIGPSSSGKSTWARTSFAPEQIVASDDLRAVVGESRYDLAASDDAFELLGRIVGARTGRGLLTVVDTLGLDATARGRLIERADEAGMTPVAVLVRTPGKTVRARNKERGVRLPAAVLTGQITTADAITEGVLLAEGFERVIEVPGDGPLAREADAGTADTRERADARPTARSGAAQVVPAIATEVAARPIRPGDTEASLRFGLQIGRFEGDPAGHAERLAAVARAAEETGFSSLWVMDHMLQIPQVGRRWEDMLESYTTLAYLAAATSTLRLGVLVTAVTFRRLPHLAKIIATLDVLSHGRVTCGLGTGWFADDHHVLGTPLPAVTERYELLRDACELLPLMWGPGSPSFEGRTLRVEEAICYPRPLQERVPILIGGSGERTTLRLVAERADACNLFGDPDRVASLVGTLHQHCRDVDRDPDQIEVTNLATVLTAPDQPTLEGRLAELTPARRSVQRTIEQFHAAPIEAQIDRFAAFAGAGVTHAIVTMPVIDAERVAELAPLIDAFKDTGALDDRAVEGAGR